VTDADKVDCGRSKKWGVFSKSVGIGMAKRDRGATLERLVGGVLFGQRHQQQGGKSVRRRRFMVSLVPAPTPSPAAQAVEAL